MARIARERWKTRDAVFDQFTLRTLFRLSATLGLSEDISPMKIGKEANVFSARTDDRTVAIKIYRLETCDFNRMYDYIRYDPRYAHLKNNRRKTIFAWTQREFRNLQKAHAAGVTVPQPYAFSNNIVAMQFIGGSEPAPQLKDARPLDPDRFFADTVSSLQLLYRAGLVHGDLSTFNILNDDERPVLIDFSQATPTNSARADELLARDAKNLAGYFAKLGIRTDPASFADRVRASGPIHKI
ncbi:serine protein kinase RIO [Candidatus Woesearchaeota archaeon]|nr:serine protein kinase RIO [Candidatus Woesearchaeota archaeon]